MCFPLRCHRPVLSLSLSRHSNKKQRSNAAAPTALRNKVPYQRGGERGGVTVIMQHEEAAGAEVAVELDEDLIGGGGHALLRRGAAELTNLR